MHETVFTQIDADVGEAPAQGVEEHQISGCRSS